jgi:trimeric autotransporter adhesin
MGGIPIRFVHVDNGGGGDGTFEDPLSDVADVFANSMAGDIVYMHGGTTFDMQGSLVLQDNQRLLGEGIAHLIDTDQFGTIPIPAVNGGPAPIISNSMADAIVMANNNEISNLVTNTPMGSGIVGAGITDFNINNVMVTGATANGLNITGASGTGLLTDSSFNQNTLPNVARSSRERR